MLIQINDEKIDERCDMSVWKARGKAPEHRTALQSTFSLSSGESEFYAIVKRSGNCILNPGATERMEP